MAIVELTGYVKYNGVRYEPGTILELTEEDALYLQNSQVAMIQESQEEDPEEEQEEDPEEDTPGNPEGGNTDGGPNGSGDVLQQQDKQPGVGRRKRNRQAKGPGNGSKRP